MHDAVMKIDPAVYTTSCSCDFADSHGLNFEQQFFVLPVATQMARSLLWETMSVASPERSEAVPLQIGLLLSKSLATAQWRASSTLVLHDGSDSKFLWLWNYVDGSVTRAPCEGEIPPPRLGHAVAVCESTSEFFLFGGATAVDEYPFYILDLTTFRWKQGRPLMNRAERAPAPRVNHTMCSASHGGVEMIIIYGGHPADVSVSGLKDAVALGFYSVFCFEVATRSWTSGQGLPMVFNHAATVFGDRFLIISAGLECRIDLGQSGDAPEVDIIDETYACDLLNNFQWQRISEAADPQRPIPPKRFGHCVCAVGSELLIAGGTSFDSRGRECVLQDMWILDVASREWRRIESFVDRWARTPLILRSSTSLLATCDLRAVYKLAVGASKVLGWTREARNMIHNELPNTPERTRTSDAASKTPGKPWHETLRYAGQTRKPTSPTRGSPTRQASLVIAPRDDRGPSIRAAAAMDGTMADPVEMLPSMLRTKHKRG
jgi:hypothetical protein